MPKRGRNISFLPLDDAVLTGKRRKPVPHEFVLEALAPLSPHTNPMFGCLAVYVGDKIVLILRDKGDRTADNGVWLATTGEHHYSLRREFPSLRSIQLLGKEVTGWQVIPADAPGFEQEALHACELVLARDPRIGKVPKTRRTSRPGTEKAAKLPAKQMKSSGRKTNARFSGEMLAVLHQSKGLRIRAGAGTHRFIGIWVVVVKDRVFVRSWSIKPNGWYRTFLREPQGAIQVEKREIAVRARPIKDERLRNAIDRAYLEKYNSPGSLKYAKDLGSAKSRDTTIELVPLSQSY